MRAASRTDAGGLRVAIVASWYPTARHPVNGIFVRDQAEALATRFNVGVVAPHVLSPRSVARGELHAGPASKSEAGLPTARPTAVRLRFAPSLSDRSYEAAVERGLKALWPSGRPNVLHAQVVLPGGLAAVRIGHRLGIPVVLTEHTGPFSAHLVSAARQAAVVETLRGADRVVAVSQGLADEIQRVADVPVEVIPNLIAPAFFSRPPFPTRSPRPLRLLAVGYLVAQKRFDVLLDAFARASATLAADLVIVGDGPRRSALVAQASRLGLAGKVRFVPMTDRSGVIGWLEWCDALVSSSDHESFGLVVAEALATGRPVITTASGGPETFVEPALGRIVPRQDVEALASAIAGTPGWLRGFDPSVARVRIAEHFGPDIFRARISAVYERCAVLGGGPAEAVT